MDKYRIHVIILLAFQFRTGYQNQAKSSLEQGQVFGGPAAHPSKFLFSSPPPPGLGQLLNVNAGKLAGASPTLFSPKVEG